MSNVICDLDGTIALDTGRSRWLHSNRCLKHKEPLNHSLLCSCEPYDRNWEAYFGACETDTPNPGVIQLLREMSRLHTIYILSGRSFKVNVQTLAWMEQHQVPYDYLQMRSVEDHTNDHELKLRWAKEFGLDPGNTLFVLEDRTRVVAAWRHAGFTCLQVAPGDF